MNQTIGVSITPQSVRPTLHYSQGDVGRVFVINVTGYDIPPGATVTCVATKPSGMGFTVNGTVSGNTVTFTSTAEMTDEWGRFPAEIRIASGSTLLGTANFLMAGEKDPHPASTIDGTQEELIPQLTLLVNRVEAAAESVHDLTVSATTLTAGSDATATYDSTNNSIAFGIPRGADGDVTRSEFNDLKSGINDGLIVVDGFYISETTWIADRRARSILIPISGGDIVDVKATNVGVDSRVAFIKNVSLPITSGASITFSSEDGYEDVIAIGTNLERAIVAPSDAEYLFSYFGLSSNVPYNRMPQRLSVNGYDYINTVTGNVKNACQKFEEIDEIRTEFGGYNVLQRFKGRWDNGEWLTDSSNSAFLKVEAGATYKIQAALDSNSPIAALKSAVLPPIDGTAIDYSSAEGWTSTIYPSYGTIIEGEVPSDTNYLYFYFGGSTLTRMPEKIVIDGNDVKTNIVQKVVDNTSKIEALESVDNSEMPIFARERNIRSYGHGGYTATYPFNSLMGYRDAKQHGFDWAETDVQFTSDNIPVLCHDDGLYTYARNPDGTRIGTSLTDTVFISEITYDQLLYYDFGLAKSSSLVGMKITTFEQLMQSAKRMNLSIAIEIKRKKTPTNAQIDILFNLIDKYHMRQNVNFCSAVTEALVYIHEKDPAMELTYIVGSIKSSVITFVESIRGYNRVAIAADKTITDDMVLLAKQKNIPINIGPIASNDEILNANPYITHFTSNGPVAEEVMLNYELSQLLSLDEIMA